MSECVVRMEMPKACWSCGLRFVCKAANDFLTTKEAGCSVLKVGMEGCLIVCQLPEGHGRLVDADENMQAIDEDIELDSRGLDDMYITGRVRERLRMDRGYKKKFKEYMRKRPTIVPADTAERSEE